MADSLGADSILVVDDETQVRNVLASFLAEQRFTVHTAASGNEALQYLRSARVAVMLCDIRMPGMSGIELLNHALRIDPDLAVLILTAVTDAATAALCVQQGAMDYLTKPLGLDDLGWAISRALLRRERLLASRLRKGGSIAASSDGTLAVLQERQLLERGALAALEALVNAYETKDAYLRGHSLRIADLATAVARRLGMTDDAVAQVRHAGRLHDLGKIGIREEIIEKPGPLTPEEYDRVKQHVTIGAQILEQLVHFGEATGYSSNIEAGGRNLAWLAHLGQVVLCVRTHHEHWDGSGYPDGLRGEEIPLGGRIICAAEVYDALSTPRPYQATLAPPQALGRMAEMSGSVLDPTVFAALASVCGTTS